MASFKKILLVLAIFTVSFDVFLTIEIGSATLRFTNIVIFLLGLVFLFEKLTQGKSTFNFIRYPMTPMFLLVAISFLSILKSGHIEKSVAYAFFALFNLIFYVWLIIEFVRSENDLRFLIKTYLLSFLFVAVFGFIQFFLPFVGVAAPLAQAFLVDGIPRVNAFSYEPAQFTTYILPGMILFLFMFSRKINFINPFLVKSGTLLLLSIIILSTARTGWIGLMLVFTILLFPGLIGFLKKWKIDRSIFRLAIAFIVLFILTSPIIYFLHNQFISFAEGLIGSQASFYRWQGVLYSLKIFSLNPILGVGVGGMGAYMVENPSEFDLAKISMDPGNIWNVSGTNVATEILATMGILGFLAWIWVLYRFSKYVWEKKNNNLIPYEWRVILQGLFWGFVVLVIILQFNQNFFRNYVWLHMGITLAVCFILSKRYLKS